MKLEAPASLPFLEGGGEMGALIRAKDWSSTPLGAVSAWPQSLRTAVSILLNSRYPMFIFWGPHLIKIYNDGYRPITGDKHPWALGRSGMEVWPEISQLATLFDMFARGEHSSGLGIGLALARRLAEMHGGTIDAASDGPGKGAEFTVRLPLAAAAKAERSAAKPDMAALEPKRILVVDDNRDAADSLGVLLEFLGADVKVAHDGREALAAFEAYRPAVVLLDIGMPGMDGYDVARAIRSRADGGVPLVALTGWGQEEDRRRVRDAGFNHHLVKPAGLEALRSLLGSL